MFLIVAAFSLISNIIIAKGYDRYIYDNTAEVPRKKVALVLGTSKYMNGRPNLYYNTRIKAAAELYMAGRVEKILVSGDHSREDYDESTDMRNDLVSLGVSEGDIYLDYAGFRTLDSVVRANKVFSLKEFVIVSQEFHCERALFIARSKGIDAVAYRAIDVRHPGRVWLMLRECLARVKAGIDVWLINKSPRFLGEKILID